MSNFSPKLENTTDYQLMQMVNELDFRVVSLVSDELTGRTVRKLKKTISVFNEQSSRQTDKMIQFDLVDCWVSCRVGLGINNANYFDLINKFKVLNL